MSKKVRYVSDSEEGISRIKGKKGFTYRYHGKIVHAKNLVTRIKKIAIPPAWENVWICASADGHLQATGFDKNGRKQYRYHPTWIALRSEKKYDQLLEFGKALPRLRKRVRKDIASASLTKEKVLATVVNLMQRTYIRIGNHEYERRNGSYGLTTLKQRHIKVRGATMKFSFRGKSGIFHTITLKSKTLARIVKSCLEIPGKTLFQYMDDLGDHHTIDSGMVNDYIREVTQCEFTAKDLRTWSGSVLFLIALKGLPDNEKDKKKNILQALDAVSNQLGNTRNVCKNYYVHPGIIKCYEENKLERSLERLNTTRLIHTTTLSPAEKLLIRVLKKCGT